MMKEGDGSGMGGANPGTKTELVSVGSPKEIVLDDIPNALVHTDR